MNRNLSIVILLSAKFIDTVFPSAPQTSSIDTGAGSADESVLLKRLGLATNDFGELNFKLKQ